MSQRFQITRAAQLDSLKIFREFITECCSKYNVPNDAVLDLKLAVDEACTNIIEHGYKGMDPGSIILFFRIGHVFEPVEVPKPDIEAALENRELGGLGLYLIYQTMDNIDYQSSEDGNTLTFTKIIK
jgi:serine/threonine-protein kinase RsbW